MNNYFTCLVREICTGDSKVVLGLFRQFVHSVASKLNANTMYLSTAQ